MKILTPQPMQVCACIVLCDMHCAHVNYSIPGATVAKQPSAVVVVVKLRTGMKECKSMLDGTKVSLYFMHIVTLV